MASKTWSIYSITSKPTEGQYSDVVYIAFWQCESTDGQFTADTMGNTMLPSPDPSGPFILYADLTQQQVLDWVFAELGAENIAAIEAGVDAKLDQLLNPPVVVLPLPWANSGV